MRSVARGLRPVMTRLFPDVPADHPAMGAMFMNIASNVAGLGNAATPFGLKAMRELDKLNRHPGVTTNAMSLFLVINTSGVAVLPIGVIAARATLGSNDPAGVIVPAILATLASTTVAVFVAKALQNRRAFTVERALEGADPIERAVGHVGAVSEHRIHPLASERYVSARQHRSTALRSSGSDAAPAAGSGAPGAPTAPWETAPARWCRRVSRS